MIKINPNDISKEENYKLLSASVIPRPISFITTLNKNGTINAAPFSFFNAVSNDPPLLMVSVLRDNYKMKDTAINILENKEYVIHVVTLDILNDINETARRLKYEENELDYTNLTLVDSTLIKTKGINEAMIRFEVKLEKHIELGDEDKISADLFIGRVLMYHLNDTIYDGKYVDLEKIKAVGRLAGNNYMTNDKIINLVRPK